MAVGKLEFKKFTQADLKYALTKQKLHIACPWCDKALTTDKNELINMGKLCKCGALLTDQGNAHKKG